MSSEIGTLLTLAGYFALLSLFAIGGANAALPEMHRLAVEVMHWMNDREFADHNKALLGEWMSAWVPRAITAARALQPLLEIYDVVHALRGSAHAAFLEKRPRSQLLKTVHASARPFSSVAAGGGGGDAVASTRGAERAATCAAKLAAN